MERAALLIQCPDRKGIVARVSQFVFSYGGNITSSDQYTTDPDNGRFFMRVEFCFDGAPDEKRAIEKELAVLGGSLEADWELHYESRVMRMAIAVSRYDHCLVDLLYRVSRNELPVTIPMVISNHEVTRPLVEQQGIPFVYLPVTKETRREQEQQILDVLRDRTDFLVLARYMQVLSEDFLRGYGKDVINIHHSFLPSFTGANPYRQAYDRGVKIIGATAHYATPDLDEGPIIEQVVERVSHRDDAVALQRVGRSLEQQALARAIRYHLEHRVMRYANKTVVFH